MSGHEIIVIIISQISEVLILRGDGQRDAYYYGCCNCMKVGKTLLALLEDGFLDFWAIVLTVHLNLG